MYYTHEIIDIVAKYERGEVVGRGSASRLVYSACNTVRDVWRAPTRLVFRTQLVTGACTVEAKLSIVSHMSKKCHFERASLLLQYYKSKRPCPRAWSQNNLLGVATYTNWTLPERMRVTMDFLSREIESLLWLVDRADQS